MPPGVSCAISGMFWRIHAIPVSNGTIPSSARVRTVTACSPEPERLERPVAREEAELAREPHEIPLAVVDLGGRADRLELLRDPSQQRLQIRR